MPVMIYIDDKVYLFGQVQHAMLVLKGKQLLNFCYVTHLKGCSTVLHVCHLVITPTEAVFPSIGCDRAVSRVKSFGFKIWFVSEYLGSKTH
jgi:hypothetical protein